jgi:hypothetical protein
VKSGRRGENIFALRDSAFCLMQTHKAICQLLHKIEVKTRPISYISIPLYVEEAGLGAIDLTGEEVELS